MHASRKYSCQGVVMDVQIEKYFSSSRSPVCGGEVERDYIRVASRGEGRPSQMIRRFHPVDWWGGACEHGPHWSEWVNPYDDPLLNDNYQVSIEYRIPSCSKEEDIEEPIETVKLRRGRNTRVNHPSNKSVRVGRMTTKLGGGQESKRRVKPIRIKPTEFIDIIQIAKKGVGFDAEYEKIVGHIEYKRKKKVDLTVCGDVESNPGPSPVFCRKFGHPVCNFCPCHGYNTKPLFRKPVVKYGPGWRDYLRRLQGRIKIHRLWPIQSHMIYEREMIPVRSLIHQGHGDVIDGIAFLRWRVRTYEWDRSRSTRFNWFKLKMWCSLIHEYEDERPTWERIQAQRDYYIYSRLNAQWNFTKEEALTKERLSMVEEISSHDCRIVDALIDVNNKSKESEPELQFDLELQGIFDLPSEARRACADVSDAAKMFTSVAPQLESMMQGITRTADTMSMLTEALLGFLNRESASDYVTLTINIVSLLIDCIYACKNASYGLIPTLIARFVAICNVSFDCISQITMWITSVLRPNQVRQDVNAGQEDASEEIEAEIQAGEPAAFITLLVGLVGTVLIGSIPSEKTMKRVTESLRFFNIVLPSIEKFGVFLSSLTQFLPECFQAWLRNICPEEFWMQACAPNGDFYNFYRDAYAVNNEESRRRALAEPQFQQYVMELYQRGHNLMEEAVDLPSANSKCMTLLTKAVKIVDDLFQIVDANRGTRGSKATPYCIYLCGARGIGKSFAMNPLARLLTSKRAGPRAIYQYNPLMKHMDGMTTEVETVMIDDFAQSRGQPGEGDEFISFINMISSTPWPIPMARLEDKGMIFNAKLVLVSSNNAYPNPNHILDKEALWRRRHMLVEVKIKPEWSTPDGQIDRAKQPKCCEHLEFYLRDSINPTAPLGPKMSNVEFFKLAKQNYEVFRKQELSALERLQEDIPLIEAMIQGNPNRHREPWENSSVLRLDNKLYSHFWDEMDDEQENMWGGLHIDHDERPECFLYDEPVFSYRDRISEAMMEYSKRGEPWPLCEVVERTIQLCGEQEWWRQGFWDISLDALSYWIGYRCNTAFTSTFKLELTDVSESKAKAQQFQAKVEEQVNVWRNELPAFDVEDFLWGADSDSTSEDESVPDLNEDDDIPNPFEFELQAGEEEYFDAPSYLEDIQRISNYVENPQYVTLEELHQQVRANPAQKEYNSLMERLKEKETSRMDRVREVLSEWESELKSSLEDLKERAEHWMKEHPRIAGIAKHWKLIIGALGLIALFAGALTVFGSEVSVEMGNPYDVVQRKQKKVTILPESYEMREMGSSIGRKMMLGTSVALPFVAGHVTSKMVQAAKTPSQKIACATLPLVAGLTSGALYRMAQKPCSRRDQFSDVSLDENLNVRPQGSNDPNADSLIYNRVVPNLLRFAPVGGMTVVGYGFYGKIVLVPAHCFFDPEGNKLPEGGDINIYVNGTHFNVPFIYAHMKKIENKDFVCYFCGPRMKSFRNSLDHFVRKEDLANHSKFEASLVGLSGVGSDFPVVQNVQVGPVDKVAYDINKANPNAPSFLLRNGWTYRANTKKGDCGSVLVARNCYIARKIVGIHIGGARDDSVGFSELITYEMLKACVDQLPAQVFGVTIPSGLGEDLGKCSVVPQGEFTYFGVMPPSLSSRNPSKTDLCHSVIYEKIFPHVKEPAVLTPDDPRLDEPHSVLGKGVSKYGRPRGKILNPKRLKRVVDDIIEELRGLPFNGPKRILTEKESINGLDYEHFDAINMQTSPGWPYRMEHRGMKGKRGLFSGDIGEYQVSDLRLREDLDKWEQLAPQGIRPMSIWTDCLKNELRPISKIKAGKTRVFCISNVAYTIYTRRYTQSFVAFMEENRLKTDSAIGINAEGFEWTQLMNKLLAVSNKGFAGDYGQYDSTLMPECMDAMCDIINAWYDDGEENALIRKVIFDEMIHTVSLVNNCLYGKHCGNPSGTPLTSLVNTLVNMIYTRYMYLELAERHAPQYCSLHHYRKHVAAGIYGDDNIFAVAEEILSWYNMQTVSAIFAEYGLEYTTATKEEITQEWEYVSELTFLKRGFRKVGPFYYPLMDKDTIQELTNWIRECGDPVQMCVDNCNDALRFAWFYGRAYFDDLRTKILGAFRSIDIFPSLMDYMYYVHLFTAEGLPVPVAEYCYDF